MDQLVVLFLCMDQLVVASLDAFRMTLALLRTGRKKAPCVSQDALVGALMGALISDLEKAYKGEQCIQGITEFLRNGKVELNILQNNKVLIRSLLSINQQCIFKRSDIKAALLDVDCRVQYRVSNGYKCSTWADDWASFFHACIMETKKRFRNCKNFARVPSWLAELFAIIKESDVDKDGSLGSQSSSACSSRAPWTPTLTPNTKSRQLVYRKSQSPSKEELEPLDLDLDKASHHYDEVHELAIKVSGQGTIQKSKKFKQLGNGMRVYIFPDGTTWATCPHTQYMATPQEDQERDESDGQDEKDHETQEEEEKDEEHEEEEEHPKPEPRKVNGKVKVKGEGKGKHIGQGQRKGKDIGQGKGKGKGKQSKVQKVTHKQLKGDYKTKERHREHSKMWHHVFNLEKKKGTSIERAKLLAGKGASAHVTMLFG